MRSRIQKAISILLLLPGLLTAPTSSANDIELPVLGDTTSGIISRQQEHELGRAWLRMFRSRVATHTDPELQQYLEQLLAELAVNSELEDRRLELVVINNGSMNAFAVPGGVVGAHTGLFQYAETEDQLASVFAHELAHLSQRHFARQVAEQRKNTLTTMTGLLAGIILAATVGGDAGIAAMTATQAAALQNSLRYSRQNEQEADREGIETMFRGGRDPAAVSAMFERMLAATRYTGQRPPEFLLTHPLTEKRVADARGRIAKYPARQYPQNEEFYFMRARALLAIDHNPRKSIDRFQRELEGHTHSRDAARYGLALALANDNRHTEAWKTLQPLLESAPGNVTVQLAAVTLDRAAGRFSQALARLDRLSKMHPNNYAMQMARAETLLKANRYQESEAVLEKLSRTRPNDPKVWYELAEVSGLAGDIAGVHQARAEYFILIGVYDKAREQLGYAEKLVRGDFKQYAIVQQRLRDLAELEEKAKKL